MAPRKGKRGNAKKVANIWDIAQAPLAPRGSVKVLARPCPIVDVVRLGKRKARTDDAVELCKDGNDCTIRLNIQDGRHKSKASNKNTFQLPWVSPQTTQEEMYDGLKSVVDKFLSLQSCDCALLAYGATGSGKTFSMQGPKRAYLKAVDGVAPNTVDENEGLLQRCLQHIFTRPSDNSTISVCAVEIYKEKIRDLLVPGARWDDPASECEILSLHQGAADSSKCNSADVKLMGQMQLRHKDKSKLREVKVEGVHTAMHTLSDALQSRTCRETKKNAESSRSHMLIGISLCAPPLQAQLDGRETQQVSKTATLWLGDLCGAEAYDQGASAQQLAETRAINQSLLSFTSCLQTLWRNQQHGERGVPPVRDSALTRVLVDIMRGVGHLALSVHFSLREGDVESTRRTLKFAEQVAELRFEAGMRLQQTVELDGTGAAPEEQGAQATDERRAVAERQARDRQRLLEYPELLRQRDWLQREIAQLKEVAVEREEAAYQDGVQTGKEEAEERHGSGEADAELLELANQDWEQRLEQAVHQAKENMHVQMCAHVEELTERAFDRESKLNGEIAALRGKLRRAGLLQERRPMQRRTLLRASRKSEGSGSDADEAPADAAPARPSIIAEEEEDEEGSEEAVAAEPEEDDEEEDPEVAAEDDHADAAMPPASGGDPSGCGSSSRGTDDRGAGAAAVAAMGTSAPDAGDGHVPEGAVESQRGGGMARSITEVAGAHRKGSTTPGLQEGSADKAATPGEDFAAVSESLRREVDAVRRWRKVQDDLEAERQRNATLSEENELLRARVERLLGKDVEGQPDRQSPRAAGAAIGAREEMAAEHQERDLDREQEGGEEMEEDAVRPRENGNSRVEMNERMLSEREKRQALGGGGSALENKAQGMQNENAALKHGQCGAGDEPDVLGQEVVDWADGGVQPNAAGPDMGALRQEAQRAIQACLEEHSSEDDEGDASPGAEISEQRYAAVLLEAMAEATDSGEDDPLRPEPLSPAAASPRGARDSEAHTQGNERDDAGAGGAEEGAFASGDLRRMPDTAPDGDDPNSADGSEGDDRLEDAVNLSIAPLPEAPADEEPSPPAERDSADAGTASDQSAEEAGSPEVGKVAKDEEEALAADAGACWEVAEEEEEAAVARTEVGDASDRGMRQGGKRAAAKGREPVVHRTTLQSLLAAVPLPAVVSGMVDVLPDAGRQVEEAAEQPAHTRRAAARGGGPKLRGRGRGAAGEARALGNAQDENAGLQVGRKGRVTRQGKGGNAGADAGEAAPLTRALRSRRN